MIRLIYSICLFAISPFLLFQLYKKKNGKPEIGKRWKEHFGYTPSLNTNTSPLWIHAVSVGEVIAAIPLIERLKKTAPELVIVVTTTTSTGAEQVKKLGNLVEHRYMPIDFCFAVNGFLNAIKPSQMLIMETELWPNTLHSVAKLGIPITVLNARLSQKSADNYHKILPLFKLISTPLDRILCQSYSDAERFFTLGVPSEKVSVTGSLKFDISITEKQISDANQLRNKLGDQRKIWIAASTHHGEEEQILAAHKMILRQHPDTLLILVPRHPERFESVFSLCVSKNFNVVRRTEHREESLNTSVQIYLANTMGEMLTLIGASDVCFIGGSLIGSKVGGHNVLEPIVMGKSVITGSSYYNFLDICNKLKEEHILTIVNNSDELLNAIVESLFKKEFSQKNTIKMQTFMKKNQGAIDNTIKVILKR